MTEPCCAIGKASAGRMHIPTCNVYQTETKRLERIIAEHGQMLKILDRIGTTGFGFLPEVQDLVARIKARIKAAGGIVREVK